MLNSLPLIVKVCVLFDTCLLLTYTCICILDTRLLLIILLDVNVSNGACTFSFELQPMSAICPIPLIAVARERGDRQVLCSKAEWQVLCSKAEWQVLCSKAESGRECDGVASHAGNVYLAGSAAALRKMQRWG